MTVNEINEIIAINKKRLAQMQAPYDPVTGAGSFSIPRVKVSIEGCPIGDMWLPVDFVQTGFVSKLVSLGFYGYIRKYLKTGPSETLVYALFKEFCMERIKYDFEFWAYMCATIERRSDDDHNGEEMKFLLNYAQRIYLKELEELRLAGQPISIILCKARQWGGSTLTQLYMLWIQLVHRKRWHSVICGQYENQSKIVRGMLSLVLKKYPTEFSGGEQITTSPFEGSVKTRMISYSESRFSIGSFEKPESIRSDHISMAHLTEVGLWRETKGKKPEDLVQSIFGSVAMGPYTVKVLESTAKGVGNYFHRTWKAAVAGKNAFRAVFIAWWQITEYMLPIRSVELIDFIHSLTDYERWLFEIGATLEGIKWYREKAREITDRWRLNSEFPSTAEEAFQSTGNRVFLQQYVQNIRRTCLTPTFFGEIIAQADKGAEALRGLSFKKSDPKDEIADNMLKVWTLPDAKEYYDRYIVSVDIGGTSSTADYSCIRVADRLPMLETGGVPEIVAEWHGHIEQDLLIWKAAQIATFYGDALLVVESNTLETDGTEGDNFEYVLDEIVDYYPNLYSRTPAEQIRKGMPAKYGFHTNTSTKPMIIKHLIACMRDGLYLERSAPVADEMDEFEYKPDGKKTGAVDGAHDDYVMATAILIYACYNWEKPTKVRKNSDFKNPTIVSEASF